MKKVMISMSVVSIFLAMTVVAFAGMTSPDPDELWTKITKESPYTEWSFWPDHVGMQPGRAPHGPLHKVYVNDQALTSTLPSAQYGSIVVKENYGKDKLLKAITVMYKVMDYNTDSGDWFWAKYSPAGQADKFGKPKGCIACHEAAADNDFIFVHSLK